MSISETVTRFSRRSLLGGIGAGAMGLTLAQIGLVREAAAQDESVQDILNIIATVESFDVTFLGNGLASAAAGTFDTPWPPLVVQVVTAAHAQEQFHLDFFQQLGGVPLTDTFTVPPETLTSFAAFFGAIVEQETAETASQIAAINTFTQLGDPGLVKIAYQYGAEEAEHRLLANYTLGVRPANDRAFAQALFTTVQEFLDSLEARGIINGTGQTIVYPGPVAIDDTNVTEREPGGPDALCVALGTPTAGMATPTGGMATPGTGIATPGTGIATPGTGLATPDTGLGTPTTGA